MKRTVLNVQQGTQEWMAERAASDGTASEAPAMMGKSKYQTRTELLDQRKHGIVMGVDASTQALFDRGHEAEALARPIAEEIIGDELSPVTMLLEVDGMQLLASLDGITFGGNVIFEHKLWSESLAEQVRTGQLDEHYTIQMDQELLVAGAEKCLFMASDGTKDKCVWMWYESSKKKADSIVVGWLQFHNDLVTHEPKKVAELPKAEVAIELPALFVHAKGEITESNMKEFGAALATRLEEVRAIKLVNDQDFANAKDAAKMFRDQIQKLKQAKEAMLSQTVTIGEAARMIDAWSEDLRVTALQLEKDVEREDLAKKRAMIDAATVAFSEHVAALEAETKPTRLNIQMPNFAGEIKGKRNYASMQDAIDTALANAKIEADKIAQGVRSKLAWCKTNAEGYGFLFSDLQQIIFKEDDDFQLLINSRIDQHKKAEEAKLEAERDRIRQEEEARAKAAVEAVSTNAKGEDAPHKLDTGDGGAAPLNPAPAIAAPAIARPAANELIDTGATMKLGQIGELLGFAVTAEFLRTLGIEPVGKERAAVLYREADFPKICDSLNAHIGAVRDQFFMKKAA